ncbi:hypothetical protein T02_5054, partial [Trichinella nativa]
LKCNIKQISYIIDAAFDAKCLNISLQMEMRIDGNLSVHQRTTRFCSDVEIFTLSYIGTLSSSSIAYFLPKYDHC